MDKIQPVKNNMNNLVRSEKLELSLREKMFLLEDIAKTFPKVDLSRQKEIEDAGQFARVDLRVEHQFSFGVYARTLYIPARVTLTGLIHKYNNFNILLKGKLKVSINDKIELIEAPFTYIAPPNSKRIFYSLEDSIWMTVIGTHEKDLQLIENNFTAKSEQEYLEFIQANQLQLELDK